MKTNTEILNLWDDQDFKPVLEEILFDRNILTNAVRLLIEEVKRLTKIIGDADGYYGDHEDLLNEPLEFVKTLGVLLPNNDKVEFLTPQSNLEELKELKATLVDERTKLFIAISRIEQLVRQVNIKTKVI